MRYNEEKSKMRYNDNAPSRSRFLSNVPSEDAEFIHRAAEETGDDIVVGNDTYNNRASHISVWTNEPTSRDHGPFWQAYRKLKGAAKGGK